MKLHVDPRLALGMMPCSRRPPRFETTFFAKATFSLECDKVVAWAEEPEFASGDVYYEGDPERGLRYPSDFAPFKPKTDVIVVGTAWAPNGKPAVSLPVAIRVGPLAKALLAVGPRRWNSSALGPSALTEPRPFVSFPMTFQHAFGGPGYARNPIGRGWHSDEAPMVEEPKRPARGSHDLAEPAGFGPIAASWPQRSSFLGTYDEKWLKQQWPFFPDDFDWSYFNAAPRDQQLDGYLRGDEELVFQNLHPTLSVIRSRLPGVRVRCFLNERLPPGDFRYREVPLVLDTVWADLDAMKVIMLWRGVTEVRTFKFQEIVDLQLAIEPIDQRPEEIEVYQAMLAAPVDVPSAPESIAAVPAESTEEDAAFDASMVDLDRQMAQADKEIGAMEAEADRLFAEQMASLPRSVDGVPVPSMTDATPAPSMDEMVAAFAPTMEQLRRQHPELATDLEGFDLGEFARAEQELNQIDDEAGRVAAEPFDAAFPWTRDRVAHAAREKHSLAEQDLRKLDLSGLDMSAVDLTASILTEANLAGANLTGAVLAGADLSGANLTGADLTNADFSGSDLTGAIPAGATFTGITLAAATLEKVDLTGIDLDGINGVEANFAGAKLHGARFASARLTRADFQGCDLTEVVFRGADLRAAQMQGATARGIDCEGADLQGLQASDGADFTGANFRGVRADGAIFEESVLDGADFSRSSLRRVQFSSASLRGAHFDRASLVSAALDDAVLIRAVLTYADLRSASFDRSDLTEADLRGANAYDAGFWLALTPRADLRDANVKSTLLS